MCQMCSGNRFAVPAPKPRIQPSLLSVGPGSRPPTHLRFGVFIRKEGKRVCPENFGRNEWQALPAYCSNAKSRRAHPISAPIPPPSPRRNSLMSRCTDSSLRSPSAPRSLPAVLKLAHSSRGGFAKVSELHVPPARNAFALFPLASE